VHDYHAVKALIARLSSQLDAGGRVAEVRIQASPVYSPEALEQAFEILAPGTPLAGSRLVVEPVPELRSCSRCGSSFEVAPERLAGHLVICPDCGEPSLLEVETGITLVGISRDPGSARPS